MPLAHRPDGRRRISPLMPIAIFLGALAAPFAQTPPATIVKTALHDFRVETVAMREPGVSMRDVAAPRVMI